MASKNSTNRKLHVSALAHAARGAEILLNVLNSPDCTGYAEVLRVLQLCRQLEELRRTAPEFYPRTETDVIRSFTLKRDALLATINTLLRPFQFRPVLSGGNLAWEPYSVQWLPMVRKKRETKRITSSGAFVIPVGGAIKLIIELLETDALNRIRQCSCGRWFFASRAKKAVCSDACRFQKSRQSRGQTFKQARAEYMRRYRRYPAVKKRTKSPPKVGA